MGIAVKGDRDWDEKFQGKVTDLQMDFWDNWKQVDYDTVQHTTTILVSMLPKLIELSHTRGKQGHKTKHDD